MNTDLAFLPEASLQPDTAILFAGWGDTPLCQPSELVPLLGRSLLQRAMERLARAGYTRIHVALGEYALAVKALLADGSRWGCRIEYHTPAATESFSDFCRRLKLIPQHRYVLASACMMPSEQDLSLHGAMPATALGSAYVWQAGDKTKWTGWGVFEGEWLLRQKIAISHAALENSLLRSQRIERRYLEPPLSAASLAELLHSHGYLLDREASANPGRGTQIHPTARIVAPVHIGQHVQIGAHAIVGPNASIGDGALIDREAHVENSVVLPATYVGEGLDLVGAIAGGDRLANAKLNTVIRVTDPNLLSANGRRTGEDRPGWAETSLARALRIVLAPLQAKLSLVANAPGRAALHAHFYNHFYPGLAEVSQGRLRMIGPTRRSLAEIGKLPRDWQALYAQHPSGLLNEAVLLDPKARMTEIQFACDAVACANQAGKSAMLKLTLSYLGQVLKTFLPATGTPRRLGNPGTASSQDEAAGIYHHSVR